MIFFLLFMWCVIIIRLNLIYIILKYYKVYDKSKGEKIGFGGKIFLDIYHYIICLKTDKI